MEVGSGEEDTWYACQRCGNCCRWPGEVPVSDVEIGRIAAHLGMEEDAFIETYTEVNRRRTGLTLRSRANHECAFLDGVDCRIQAVKPDQCAGFPNRWNFPGWREVCEAIPVHRPRSSSSGNEEGAAG